MTTRKLLTIACDGVDPGPDLDNPIRGMVRCTATFADPHAPQNRSALVRLARAAGWKTGDWDYCPQHIPAPR